MEIKQVILIRMKYPDGKGGTRKVRFGKLAAQVAHASHEVFKSCLTKETKSKATLNTSEEALKWLLGNEFKKVVLKVKDEETLLKAHQEAQKRGLLTSLIQDKGHTVFKGVPTYTAVAIGPALSEDIDLITGKEGIIPTKLA